MPSRTIKKLIMKKNFKALQVGILILGLLFTFTMCSDDFKGTTPDPEENYDPEEILDDIKIPVKSATASSFQNGEGIELSFDDDLNTMYHSAWDNSAEDYFPITLTYNFENAGTMDYLIYNPRIDGTNGLIKEFDLYVATESSPEPKLYKSYDFKGSSTASRINFDPALEKPTQIQFVVKSGVGDDQGFVSCAEMEFFQKNDENFNYLRIFTDETATVLRDTVTEKTISSINNKFFKNLATEILNGTYATEFRVQEYKSWQHPDIMSKLNKTNTYGLRDNPTGIYAAKDEEIMVFVGDLQGQDVSILIQESGKKVSGTSYALTKGMNKIKAKNPGLLYVMYYTETGTEGAVKINIASGTVNGYFDKQKHQQSDWQRLINAATYADFDVVGQYAILTFRTDAYKQYTSDGLALINKYDDLVYQQQDFMGLVKYDKMFKNKAHFLVVDEGYMYSGGYHTGYNADTQSEILNPDLLGTTAIWGPAHELGHTHQTRPGLRWAGMAEVTNNIHSLYIQTLWGNTSRQIADDRYNTGFNSTLVNGLALNDEPDVFCRLIPFWQLKLYVMDVLGKTDFYKDIYEYIRVNPDVSTSNSDHGLSQLQFVKVACDIAELDLTEFFELWGFLKPIDKTIDDYGTYPFKITQSEIDAVKAQIAAKGYSKPSHRLQYITDENTNLYKSNTSITSGTATASGNSITFDGWSGVAVFEAYKNGVLDRITMSNSIGLTGDVSEYEIWAVASTGDKVKVNVTSAGGKIGVSSAVASVFQSGEGIDKSFDGDFETMYHSPWTSKDEDYPITLTYNFKNVSKMSYIIYHPRTTGGNNGKFKDFDLYIATESNPTLTKYDSYDFEGKSEASRIDFATPIEKPTQIQFVVNKGVGGFVSCAEMEFYRE